MVEPTAVPTSLDAAESESPGEVALVDILLRKGLLSAEQLEVVRSYAREHNRNLRQSILELNLISSETLTALAFSRLHSLGLDLRLMSAVNGVSRIPTEGRDLVVVAAVDRVLHFRIFDGDGKMVVDTDEKRLTERVRPIDDLRNQLESLWPPHELTVSEKVEVITAVTSIVDHTPLSATVPDTVLVALPSTDLDPDRRQHYQDICKELQEKSVSSTLSELTNDMLVRACDLHATDIHFDPVENGLRVRYRIDGQLRDVLLVDQGMATPVIQRLKIMSDLDIFERRHAQEGRITILHRNRLVALRVSTVPTMFGDRVVIRIPRDPPGSYILDQLGVTPAQAEAVRKLISKPSGMVLVAGPVAAGKTATAYACLNEINTTNRSIMTTEDPIEHRIQGISQIQIDTKHGMGFTESLRATLRQDPNVLLISEIRDEETARIAVRAARSGVLVIATIDATDTAGPIDVMFDLGVPSKALSRALEGIISQRLIRKICPYCRVSYRPDSKDLEALGLDPSQDERMSLHRGLGCPACFSTGYLGRTAVFEVMEVTPRIRKLILNQADPEVLRRAAQREGMTTLRDSAVERALDGTTTLEEVLAIADSSASGLLTPAPRRALGEDRRPGVVLPSLDTLSNEKDLGLNFSEDVGSEKIINFLINLGHEFDHVGGRLYLTTRQE